jgi:hypothetical protein
MTPSCSWPRGLRHDEQARLHRTEPETHLIEQRQEKRHAADPQAREEAAADRRAEGPDPEQLSCSREKREISRAANNRRAVREKAPNPEISGTLRVCSPKTSST